MTMSHEPEVEQYFYRSSTVTNRHRNRVSAYYVQRSRGAKIVARIEPLGLVPVSIGDEQLAIQRLRRNLIGVGSWHATPSGHHSRQRVASVEVVATKKVAPQNS
jgi:hypothetical protein